jgi:hypothetical protein
MRLDKQLVVEFIQAYNYVHGSSFDIESWPEDEDRNTPAVEAIARDGNQLMAIEHTLAQPFVGERHDSAIFRRVVVPIETDESLLVQGYDVIVSTNVGAIPPGGDGETSADVIREWLRRELQNLPEGKSRHKVPGLAYQLELFIEKTFDDTPGFRGSLFVMRNAPEDTLHTVLETALRKKLPKLSKTRADVRILLLERADVLGGYHRFGASLRQLLIDEFDDLKPDEIWLVNTMGFERENVLFFYKLWPIYFEHRIRRGKDKELKRLT